MIAFVLLLAASAAPAQHWEFEQVDTVHWAQRTWLRTHPELGLVVGYSSDDSGLRIAWKDSAWNRLDMPLPAGSRGATSLDVAPDGRVGVVFTDSEGLWTYAERRLDSAWQVSVPPVSRYANAALTFDTLGHPHLLVGTYPTEAPAMVHHLTRADSTWQVDTVAAHQSTPGWNSCNVEALTTGSTGAMACAYSYHWSLMAVDGARPISTSALRLATTVGNSWQTRGIASVTAGGFGSIDLAFGPDDTAGYCYGISGMEESEFRCGAESVTTDRCGGAALAIDTEGHPLIACVRNRGTALTLLIRDTAWHALEPGIDYVAGLDIASPGAREVLVSYVDGGAWLAHGVDIVGVEEPEPAPGAALSRVPTVVRNVLTLPGNRGNDAAPTILMDASGRRVLELHPGPNDISHLSPGVYFIHSPVASRQSPPATKVVIQR